jgi:hypothetical protein
MIYCQTFKPVSFSDASKIKRPGSHFPAEGVYHILKARQLPIRIFAGQPTPGDASAFTVKIESAGKAATIRGRLCDDGNISLDVADEWLRERWGPGLSPRHGRFVTVRDAGRSRGNSPLVPSKDGASAGY